MQEVCTSQECTWDDRDIDVIWQNYCIFAARVAGLVGAQVVGVAGLFGRWIVAQYSFKG